MANNAQNVNVGKPSTGGAIYIAPSGTQLPTSASEKLNNAFKALGYVSDAGLTNSNSPESDDIKAWGGDTVYSLQTGKDDTFQFTLIESVNVEVLKFVYGDDNVEGDDLSTGITIKANSKELTEHALVIDMIMRNDALRRIVIPSGKITELGDITYTDDEIVGYEVTVTAVPDDSGNTHYDYMMGAASASLTRLEAIAESSEECSEESE